MPRHMFPPHPATQLKMMAADLETYEKQGGWIAQRKFNGSNTVANWYKGKLTLWNRQGQPFTYYTLTESMVQCFLALDIDPENEVIFNGELLHTKAKYSQTGVQAATDTIVLYDLLCFEGSPLIHDDYETRYAKLAGLCKHPTKLEPVKQRALEVVVSGESKLWLAESFLDDFSYHFYEMYAFTPDKKHDLFPEIEGLVLKRQKDSYIEVGVRPYDVRWMMRCRKEKKKTYQF